MSWLTYIGLIVTENYCRCSGRSVAETTSANIVQCYYPPRRAEDFHSVVNKREFSSSKTAGILRKDRVEATVLFEFLQMLHCFIGFK